MIGATAACVRRSCTWCRIPALSDAIGCRVRFDDVAVGRECRDPCCRRCWPTGSGLRRYRRARGSRRPGRGGESGSQGDDAGSRRWRWVRTASMTATWCGPAGPRRCSGTAWRRRRRWGRFCARLRSVTSASSTVCWPTAWPAPGGTARAPAIGGWSSMSTRSSARCSAMPRRARRSGTQDRRRISPAAGHARRHGRGAAHPAAQGRGQQRPRRGRHRRRVGSRASPGPGRPARN